MPRRFGPRKTEGYERHDPDSRDANRGDIAQWPANRREWCLVLAPILFNAFLIRSAVVWEVEAPTQGLAQVARIMPTRLAVAIVHGVGIQTSDFAEPMIAELTDRFADELGVTRGEATDRLAFEAVHWAPVLQNAQTRLWRKVGGGGDLDFVKLRKFMVDFAGDAIAYQPTPKNREVYDSVHTVLAGALRSLARNAGTKAPLCVIAHSLGTIITSNYFYDLSQSHRPGMVSKSVRAVKKRTPLENGETLALLYTLGSPLAVWSLRYKDFGVPIPVPSPELGTHHPGVTGEWVNFYDPDDVIGYPLRSLNDAYKKSVDDDVAVNVGGLLTSWNPASHVSYWTDNDVTKPIAKALARLWKQTNDG